VSDCHQPRSDLLVSAFLSDWTALCLLWPSVGLTSHCALLIFMLALSYSILPFCSCCGADADACWHAGSDVCTGPAMQPDQSTPYHDVTHACQQGRARNHLEGMRPIRHAINQTRNATANLPRQHSLPNAAGAAPAANSGVLHGSTAAASSHWTRAKFNTQC
jgi:hypothetical protein